MKISRDATSYTVRGVLHRDARHTYGDDDTAKHNSKRPAGTRRKVCKKNKNGPHEYEYDPNKTSEYFGLTSYRCIHCNRLEITEADSLYGQPLPKPKKSSDGG